MDNKEETRSTIISDGSLSNEKCEFLISYDQLEDEMLERKSYGSPKTSSEKALLSKAIIAMANSEGGYVLLGVNDDLSLRGIQEDSIDPADLNNLASNYVTPQIKNIKARIYEKDNIRIGIVYVPPSDSTFHVTIKDGGPNNELKKNTIYVRHSGQSDSSDFHDLQKIIDRAARKKQAELFQHLEEAGLVSTKKTREQSQDSINLIARCKENIFLVKADFYQLVEELCLLENVAELKLLIRLIRKIVISEWKSTVRKSKDEIFRIKDDIIQPLIDKLTYLIMLAMNEKLDNTLISLWADAMADIYSLATDESLGSREVEEWQIGQGGHRIRFKKHATFSYPSKEVIKRMMIVGAYATQLQNWEVLRQIASKTIKVKKYNEVRTIPIVTHPLFNYASGEGTLTSIFDEVSESVNSDEYYFEFFGRVNENVTNSILEADFLFSFDLFVHNANYRYMNFPRFYAHRLRPLVSGLVKKEDPYQSAIVGYSFDQVEEFVKQAKQFAKSEYWGLGSDWYYDDLFTDLFVKSPPQM